MTEYPYNYLSDQVKRYSITDDNARLDIHVVKRKASVCLFIFSPTIPYVESQNVWTKLFEHADRYSWVLHYRPDKKFRVGGIRTILKSWGFVQAPVPDKWYFFRPSHKSQAS